VESAVGVSRSPGLTRTERPGQVALALLGFSVALCGFLLVPPFLHGDVGWVPYFTGQEAADLLTPIVTMPLLVLAIELAGRSGTRARVVLMALVVAWVAGQGIHLAANAIGDVFPAGTARDAFYGTAVGALDHFFDEELSHWLWHGAWVGLLFLLLWVGSAGPAEAASPGRAAIAVGGAAGLIHGFTWFVVTDEGGTLSLASPATAVLLVLALLRRRQARLSRVVAAFLITGAVATLALYAIIIAVSGWPPLEPCEVISC
jgi:hypothetical protein